MNSAAFWQTVAQIILGLGGLGGMGVFVRSLFLARADKRAKDAGSGKTSAETVTELSGVAVALLKSAPAEIARLHDRLKEADEHIDELTEKIRAQSRIIDQQDERIGDMQTQLEAREREAEALHGQLDQLNIQLTEAQLEVARLRPRRRSQ